VQWINNNTDKVTWLNRVLEAIDWENRVLWQQLPYQIRSRIELEHHL
jgi:hypothetical protein